jgi:hypothetical protein
MGSIATDVALQGADKFCLKMAANAEAFYTPCIDKLRRLMAAILNIESRPKSK